MTKGIDVSQWQGTVDWNAVKNAGVAFVILRDGYRNTIDPRFLEYVKGIQNAGIKIPGIYHFLYSVTDDEARKEADSAVSFAEQAGLPKSTIIFADFEYDSVDKAAQRGVAITRENCTAMTIAFCERVKEKGYTPGIYYNQDFRNRMYDMSKIGGYSQWLAHYTTEKPRWACDYMQDSSTGKVNGIKGNVDTDREYRGTANTKSGEKLLKSEVAAQLMTHLVEHWYHGYSQSIRWGDGEGYCYVTIGGKTYALAQGDRDCSSAVINAYEVAGIPVKTNGATYTGNMKDVFVRCGFKWHPMRNGACTDGYKPKRGDVALNIVHHTAMFKNPDTLMQFSISETGGVTGADGDQLQNGEYDSSARGESNTRSFYDYPWDGVLEAPEVYTDGTTNDTPTKIFAALSMGSKGDGVRELQKMLTAIGYSVGSAGIDGYFGSATLMALEAFQKSSGIIVDGIYGNQSQAALVAAYNKIQTNQDVRIPHIEYAVKTLHHGILQFVRDREDFAGYANDAIMGIAIRAVDGGSVKYRVHASGRWFGWVTGCNWNDIKNGYAGNDKDSIDAIQIMYYTDIHKTGGKYYRSRYQVKPYDRKDYCSNIYDTDFSNTDGGGTAGIFGHPFTQILIDLVEA